ncbi:MAG: hypothetical protein LBS35_11575 [Synergistaceae bacterium]|jgi:hypothetical protein|nr:hypothetical protein [Synergistaceae bacterium]
MKKLQPYLETSVISYLDQQDALFLMAETHKSRDLTKAGRYDVTISNIIVDEINRCKDDKKAVLFGYVAEVEYRLLAAHPKRCGWHA